MICFFFLIVISLSHILFLTTFKDSCLANSSNLVYPGASRCSWTIIQTNSESICTWSFTSRGIALHLLGYSCSPMFTTYYIFLLVPGYCRWTQCDKGNMFANASGNYTHYFISFLANFFLNLNLLIRCLLCCLWFMIWVLITKIDSLLCFIFVFMSFNAKY